MAATPFSPQAHGAPGQGGQEKSHADRTAALRAAACEKGADQRQVAAALPNAEGRRL